MKDNFNNLFQNELKKREAGTAWSSEIASRVLSRKTRKNKIYKKSAAAAMSLSIAALVLIFFFVPEDSPEPDMYNTMISAQVDGTYKEVFSYAGNDISSNDDDIDNIIDETLSMR